MTMGSPILDLTQQPIASWVMVKANVGGWFFDAVLNVTRTSTLTITSNPIQLGSSVSDYAYLNPKTLSMEIGMTDVATSFIPGQFAGAPSRSVAAYEVLFALQAQRIPVQVTTRVGVWQNMLIASLSDVDDNTTTHALRATVDFQQLLVASVQIVQISANPAVTGSLTGGPRQPKQLSPAQQNAFLQLQSALGHPLP